MIYLLIFLSYFWMRVFKKFHCWSLHCKFKILWIFDKYSPKASNSCFFNWILLHQFKKLILCDYVSRLYDKNFIEKCSKWSICWYFYHIFFMRGYQKFYCWSLHCEFKISWIFDKYSLKTSNSCFLLNFTASTLKN